MRLRMQRHPKAPTSNFGGFAVIQPLPRRGDEGGRSARVSKSDRTPPRPPGPPQVQPYGNPQMLQLNHDRQEGDPGARRRVPSPPHHHHHHHRQPGRVVMPVYGLSKRGGGGGGGGSQTRFPSRQGLEPTFLERNSGNPRSPSVPPPIICVLGGFCHRNQTPSTNCAALLIT